MVIASTHVCLKTNFKVKEVQMNSKIDWIRCFYVLMCYSIRNYKLIFFSLE